MSEPREEVALIPSGENYILRRTESDGKETHVELTKANLLSFRPLLVRECLRILQSLATPDLIEQGVSPSVDLAVRKFSVANDLHEIEIYLSLEDVDGNEFRFSFSVDAARLIGNRLIQRADQMDASKTARTKQ